MQRLLPVALVVAGMTNEQKIKSYRDDVESLTASLIGIKRKLLKLAEHCEELLADMDISDGLRRAKPKPKRAKK
jgi:hypothetical protein